MPGEFFFMAIGGLGVSLAGFAGLIAALDSSPESPLKAWRIRNIVLSGFLLTFIGFGTVACHTLTEDAQETVRIMSGVAAGLLALRMSREIRPGPAWPARSGLVVAYLIGGGLIALLISNVWIASVGFFQVLLIVELTDPAIIFLNTVRDVTAVPRF